MDGSTNAYLKRIEVTHGAYFYRRTSKFYLAKDFKFADMGGPPGRGAQMAEKEKGAPEGAPFHRILFSTEGVDWTKLRSLICRHRPK